MWQRCTAGAIYSFGWFCSDQVHTATSISCLMKFTAVIWVIEWILIGFKVSRSNWSTSTWIILKFNAIKVNFKNFNVSSWRQNRSKMDKTSSQLSGIFSIIELFNVTLRILKILCEFLRFFATFWASR